LTEHGRFGLDAAHTPAQNPEAIDHGRVRVGADERVRVHGAPVGAGHDHARQVLEIDLVDDARVGGHDLEVSEGALPPLQKLVSLAVPMKLKLRVHRHRVGRAEGVDLDGVIDDELDGLKGINLRRVTPQSLHGVAHGREIDHSRNTREIL
jgi:hypothetical protein